MINQNINFIPGKISRWPFRSVPSFPTILIFFNNSSKNGLLLVQLAKKDIDTLFKFALNKKKFIVDLIKKKILVKETTINFDIDHIIKSRLINGYDDIELTLKKSSYIENYENDNNKFHSWKNIENER